MAQCDVPNLVLLNAPRLIRLDLPLVDTTYGLAPEELLRTREAGCYPAMAVRVLPVLHFTPLQEFLCCVTELAYLDLPKRLPALAQCLTMLRFLVFGLAPVLFRGVQAGCFCILSAVHFEAVVPNPSAVPQCHRPSPLSELLTILARDPLDTRHGALPSGTPDPCLAISSPRVLPPRGKDSAPAPRERASYSGTSRTARRFVPRFPFRASLPS